jgi:hypothetical protein
MIWHTPDYVFAACVPTSSASDRAPVPVFPNEILGAIERQRQSSARVFPVSLIVGEPSHRGGSVAAAVHDLPRRRARLAA